MKKIILNLVTLLSFNLIISQTTEKFTLTNGDGWYRIIEKDHQGSGKIKITGITGSNKVTNLTMFVSLMEYAQGGSINIIENSFYNGNHIKEIRGGSDSGKYVLDIYLENINDTTNISITRDDNIDLLAPPRFITSSNLTGEISISGKVIGISSTRHPIYFSNYVGIGTTYTKGFKLGVNGKIAAEEVKVALYDNWSDFVFKKDYKLPSLNDVENFIEEKGHLKDIPSEKEVYKNGIYLGEMDSKLLQKIEELTLYTIQQEKKIEKIEKENEYLKVVKNKFIELQKRIDKLETK